MTRELLKLLYCSVLLSIIHSNTATPQLEQQQEIIDSPTNTYAKLGDNGVLFKCKFKNLKGEPQWCLDDFCLRITKDMTLKGRSRHRIVGNHTNGEFNLLIDNIQLQDNMFYYCMATAASETIGAVKSDKAFLTVLTPPESVQLENPVHVSLNKASTVQCVARRSRPSVKLFISINNQLIDDETKYKTSIVAIPTTNSVMANVNEIKKLPFYEQIKYYYYDTFVNLTLEDVNMQLNGKSIECVAYEIPITTAPASVPSKLKPLMNKMSTIQVNYAPEVNLRLMSANKTLQENDVVTLVCETKAMPTVQAYKYGKVLPSHQPQLCLSAHLWYLGKNYINGVNDDKLNLKLRKEMNMKTITCEAINIVASVKASIQLNIHYKPYFIHSNEQFSLFDVNKCQKQITLDCQVLSNPPSNITWFKSISPTYRQHIGYGPTFTIPTFNCGLKFKNNSLSENRADRDDDFGLYVCEANNGVVVEDETNKRFIKINPLGVPSLRLLSETEEYTTTETNVKYASVGSHVLLTCIIEPLPRYNKIIWYKNYQKIFNSKYLQNDYNAAADYRSYDEDGDEYDDENMIINENIEVKYINTTQGLKSYLKMNFNSNIDNGRYTCKVFNRHGTSELSVILKENTFLSQDFNFKLKFYFLLIVVLSVVLVALVFVVCCVTKRYCRPSRRQNKIAKPCIVTGGLGQDAKDCSLSANIINESGSTSGGSNSEKTINEWLIHTSSTASSGHDQHHHHHHPPAHRLFTLDRTATSAQTPNEDDIDETDELMAKMLYDTPPPMMMLPSPPATSSSSKSYYLSDIFQNPTPSPNHHQPQQPQQYNTLTTMTSNFKPNIQIHSNMKNIPYTTLTRLAYQNNSPPIPSTTTTTSIIKTNQSPLIKLKFNENNKCLGISTSSNNIKFQTIV